MKAVRIKKRCAWKALLSLGVLLIGCSTLTPVPDGSQPQGTYQGLVWGGIDGSIQVNLFLTSTGDQIFAGQFVDAGNGAVSEFRGTLLGNTLDGKIGLMLGTITGQLSPDGSQMSGEMKFAQYHLTWNASLQ